MEEQIIHKRSKSGEGRQGGVGGRVVAVAQMQENKKKTEIEAIDGGRFAAFLSFAFLCDVCCFVLLWLLILSAYCLPLPCSLPSQ